MNDFTTLWSLDAISDDPGEAARVQNILRIYKFAIVSFTTMGSCHAVAFIVIPLAAGGFALPFEVWLPESNTHVYHKIVFAIEAYIILSLVFLVCGIDALFISLCGTIAIQFRLLSHKTRKLKADFGEKHIRATLRDCLLHQKCLIT